MIRLARAEDIPRLQELLGQILLVHHYVRPDVFKSEGSKYTDAELEAALIDFTYVKNTTSGMYEITGWKGTRNGVTSTECIFPNNEKIMI